MKKEKDGNATDWPNQSSERHGSSLLISNDLNANIMCLVCWTQLLQMMLYWTYWT